MRLDNDTFWKAKFYALRQWTSPVLYYKFSLFYTNGTRSFRMGHEGRRFVMHKEENFMTEYNYFCGSENEKFSFFRIPRALMKDAQFRELSTDAKLLYGLMLDRMGLSRQSGWIDADKRVYIYFTLDEIQNTLYCGHNKAVRILAELEKYTLIERIKQGLGKPARIYVTNILAATEKLQRSQTSRKSRLLEVGKSDLQTSPF